MSRPHLRTTRLIAASLLAAFLISISGCAVGYDDEWDGQLYYQGDYYGGAGWRDHGYHGHGDAFHPYGGPHEGDRGRQSMAGHAGFGGAHGGGGGHAGSGGGGHGGGGGGGHR